MAYLRLEAEAAYRFWQNVRNDLDLLDAVQTLDSPSEPSEEKSIEAKLKLITFLANAGFGEEDVLRRRGERRRGYFAALSKINSDIFQLYYAHEPLKIEVVLEDGIPHDLQLGRAVGYSSVIPLTEEGRDAYLENRISAFQFTEEHILGKESFRRSRPGRAPCCLYGEGVFHLGALANSKLRSYVEGGFAFGFPKTSFIFQDLFRHFSRFMPRLRLAEVRGKLQIVSSGDIPLVIFADNGAVAESLRGRGFIAPPDHPSKGLAGYPRYVLDCGDYNRVDVSSERKKAISRLLGDYLKVIGEEPIMSYLDESPAFADSSLADVVVITMRDDEFDSVHNRLNNPVVLDKGNRTYKAATLAASGGEKFRVAVVQALAQGIASAQDAARDAIEDLQPKLLVLCGIAGATPDDDFTLGDVVAATRLHDFSVGAHLRGGKTQLADLGGPMHKGIQNFVVGLRGRTQELRSWNTEHNIGRLRPKVIFSDDKFIGSDDWKRRVKESLARHFQSENPRISPRFVARPIVSDGYLAKDPELLERWLASARDLAAIEMELPGVFAAARRRSGDIPVLAIRGISDIVGYKREAEWTAYAAESAGSFCLAALEILSPEFVRERT